jgi:cyclopropane fatty-acyl-phospholipid synthase-like methyltransferase
MLVERYLTDEEYATYFSRLADVRQRVVKDMPVKSGMHILDLASGYGFFAITIANQDITFKVSGIDISRDDIMKAEKNIKIHGLTNQVKMFEMDATNMAFEKEKFDMVSNFLGLEDIHMTRGKQGVQKTFFEVYRVLKLDRYFCFVIMPTDEMETRAQKLEVGLWSYVCNAAWLDSREYKAMLEKANFKLIDKKYYYTHKKLTPEQARKEIKYACENVPKIYGIELRPFIEIWNQYGEEIEKYGLGQYSKLVLVIAQKQGG